MKPFSPGRIGINSDHGQSLALEEGEFPDFSRLSLLDPAKVWMPPHGCLLYRTNRQNRRSIPVDPRGGFGSMSRLQKISKIDLSRPNLAFARAQHAPGCRARPGHRSDEPDAPAAMNGSRAAAFLGVLPMRLAETRTRAEQPPRLPQAPFQERDGGRPRHLQRSRRPPPYEPALRAAS